LGEKRGVAIEVIPADLNHADVTVGEVVDGVVENVARGDEVGVENGDELAGGGFEAFLESAGLVARPVFAVHEANGISLGGPFLTGPTGNCGRMVGAVVENLYFEPVERVIDLAGGPDDAFGYRILIEHRELDGDAGEFVKVAFGRIPVISMFAIEI